MHGAGDWCLRRVPRAHTGPSHHLKRPWPYLGTDVRDPPDGHFAQGASASQTASLGPPLGNAGPDQPLLPRSSILCPRSALGPDLRLSRGSYRESPVAPALPRSMSAAAATVLRLHSADSAKLLETQSHPSEGQNPAPTTNLPELGACDGMKTPVH